MLYNAIMKILFITDLIPIDDNEICAKALIPIIKELQFDNIVDVVRPNFLLNSLIRGKMIKPDGKYSFSGVNFLNLNFITPFCFPLKNKVINLSDYDKIVAHMPSGILFAERLIKDYGKQNKNTKLPQLVYAVHQSDIQVMTSWKYSIYFKNSLINAFKRCDEIACRSVHLKNKFLKILPECENKTIVKSSKILRKYFVSESEMLAKFENVETLNFVTAANMIKRKNIDVLIKAFSNFKEKKFRLKIIGDGKEFKNLQKLVKKLALNDKIVFTGKLSTDDVFKEMRSSQVFVLPSVNETLGLVYLEASASGCFCIGTKNTGIDGIFLDNINCFLCNPTIKGVSQVLDKTFNLTKDDFQNLLLNRKLIESEFIS